MASSLVLRFAKENKRFHQCSGRMVQMGKKTSHRSKHRARSHSESHAQGTITPVLEGNPLVPTGEARWIDAEKDFDLLVLPNAGHGFGNRRYFMKKRWDYFVRHLAKMEPISYRFADNIR